MSKDTKDGITVVGVLIFIWLTGYMSGCGGSERHLKDLRQQAVERGYAQWKLTHADDGSTEFRWLDKPSPPSPETAPPQPADQ